MSAAAAQADGSEHHHRTSSSLTDCPQPMVPITSRLKKALRFGVAVDGSLVSELAVRTAASLLNRSRRDRLFILTVTDSKKSYLSPTLQPTHLKKVYEGLADSLHVDATWYQREKVNGGTFATLQELVTELQLDFLIVGSFGRKGAENKLNVLGTVSDSALKNVNTNVIVVKASSNKTLDGPKKYVVAADNSHASRLAFENVLSMMSKQDEVIVVSVSSVVSTTAILIPYEEAIAAAGVKGRTVFQHAEQPLTAETLVRVAESAGADFMVMGVNGYGERPLGSVSEGIVLTARCSTVVVKRAVDDGGASLGGARGLLPAGDSAGRLSRPG